MAKRDKTSAAIIVWKRFIDPDLCSCRSLHCPGDRARLALCESVLIGTEIPRRSCMFSWLRSPRTQALPSFGAFTRRTRLRSCSSYRAFRISRSTILKHSSLITGRNYTFPPPPHPKGNPTHVGGFWMWKGGMYAGHRRWTSRSISDVASLDCGRWFPLTLHMSPYSQPVAPEGELWGCSKVLPCGLLHLSSLALWSSRIAETVRSRSSSPHGRRLRDRRVDDARQLGRASILSNAYRGSLLQGPLVCHRWQTSPRRESACLSDLTR